jgi:hypothetical protein
VSAGGTTISSNSRTCGVGSPGPWYHRPKVLIRQVVSAPGTALRWVWQLLVSLVTSAQRLLVTLVTSIQSGAWRLVRSVLELVGLSFLLLLGLVFGPWYQHNRWVCGCDTSMSGVVACRCRPQTAQAQLVPASACAICCWWLPHHVLSAVPLSC